VAPGSRQIRAVVDDALCSGDAAFDRLCGGAGRSSIAPERLIRARLLQILHSIRSERQFTEQMDHTLLFRWFVGLGVDDPVWGPRSVLQEPRPAAERGHVTPDHGRNPGASRGGAAAVR
jgi:transposase